MIETHFHSIEKWHYILQEIEKQKQLEEVERQMRIVAAKKEAEEKQKKLAESNQQKSDSNQQLGVDPNQKVRRASRFEIKTIVTPPEDENREEGSNRGTSPVPLAPKEDTTLTPESKEGE